MSVFILITLVVIVFGIIYQIAKASEYAAVLNGEEKVKQQTNKLMASLLVAFFLLGMYGIVKCHTALMKHMIPESASVEGVGFDSMFTTTLIVTGIVFVITQTLLFWFVYKYQSRPGSKAAFISHNNKLELIWTTIPAIVMAGFLVICL